MATATEAFKINLNQNLWGLIVCLGFLGVAEFYKLNVLFWFAVLPASIMVLSVCITTISYTRNYITKKDAP